MAARAATGEVTVGVDGRLHAAALHAIAEPDSLRELLDRCQDMMPPSTSGT
jgi:hypothetical protein